MPERYGYTSFGGEPVDSYGRPEHQSGRVNHQHMDRYANRHSLSFEKFAKHRPGKLYSSNSKNLENIPSREHPLRSEPSQVTERSVRGYNPAWHGSIRSLGSSSQIHDDGYTSEATELPRGTPMGDGYKEYKSLTAEADNNKSRYKRQAQAYENEAAATQDIPASQRRFNGIGDYHRHAENTAFRTGDSYHLASRSRSEHNLRYIGHFKDRDDFDRHEQAAEIGEMDSEKWHAVENEHRRRRPRDPPRHSDFDQKVQAMIDDAYPEEPEYQGPRPGKRLYDREGKLVWR